MASITKPVFPDCWVKVAPLNDKPVGGTQPSLISGELLQYSNAMEPIAAVEAMVIWNVCDAIAEGVAVDMVIERLGSSKAELCPIVSKKGVAPEITTNTIPKVRMHIVRIKFLL